MDPSIQHHPRPAMMRRARREDGAAAVEFGLILPVLVLILLGILDYGYAFMVKLTLTNAAREAARVGVTLPADESEAAAKAAAERYLTSAGITKATVDVVAPTDDTPEVAVTIDLDPFEPLIGFVPPPAKMSASSIMRWELAPIP
jgi:Flp pilus assembly protein TadG